MKKKFLYFIAAVVVLLGVMLVAGNINSPQTNRRAREHAEAALAYCQRNGMSTDYCFLVDFDVHSGKNRFFVWDFNKQRIVYSTICEHGRGRGSTHMRAEFSNEPGSNCSSLGRYQVLNRRMMYRHKNTPCIVLRGMDSSNSRALSRGILIHPSVWQFPSFPIPAMWRTEGCFGLSRRGFDTVDNYRKASSRPILLWAYAED